jgi:hypothetical protein
VTRLTPEYRPTHSNNLTTGKIVDYAIHFEPSGTARDVISSLVRTSTESINHVGYEAMRVQPIAVSIETKTNSRGMEEAQVQLGVWVAAQVTRIEALISQRASLVANEQVADAQSHMSTPGLTIMAVADPSIVLSHTVFPLIEVQAKTWSLSFARVTPSSALPNAVSCKPLSNIKIFESITLGNTGSVVQTYRLVKSLRVLRDWADGDFRKWWDKVLGVEAGGE